VLKKTYDEVDILSREKPNIKELTNLSISSDQRFLVVFKIALWIARKSDKEISKP
jgi:hypothetical protein